MQDEIHANLKTKIEHFFEDNARDYGTIDHPTKNGLISLALKGRDMWNAWASTTDCKIDFSNYHFGTGFDFSGFFFPGRQGWISFKDCKFENARFANSIFSGDVDFSGAEISNASFTGCDFTGTAAFSKCKFVGAANFSEAKFLGIISLYGSIFNQDIDFSSAQFHQEFACMDAKLHGHSKFNKCKFLSEVSFTRVDPLSVDFSEATFLKKLVFAKNKVWAAEFSAATFHDDCFFNESAFHAESFFRDCEFKKHASYRGCTFSDHIEFDRTKFQTLNFSCSLQESEPEKSLKVWNISFRGCEFSGTAKFDNRNFSYRCDFGSIEASDSGKILPTRFHKAPMFHGSKFHQDTTFHGAVFIQDYGDEAARAYRTLKLAMEQLKATRDEQRFFQLEMKAEKPGLKGWKWLVSSTYELLSDYGFSLRRPLAFWLLALVLFGGAHSVLANKAVGAGWIAAMTPHPDNLGSAQTQKTLQYVVINAVPAPGLDRKSSALREQLFTPERAPDWIASAAILLEILHKAATLLCLFLIGLSIRNLLKMKS